MSRLPLGLEPRLALLTELTGVRWRADTGTILLFAPRLGEWVALIGLEALDSSTSAQVIEAVLGVVSQEPEVKVAIRSSLVFAP